MQVSSDIASRLYDLARPATKPDPAAERQGIGSTGASAEGGQSFGRVAADFVSAMQELSLIHI